MDRKWLPALCAVILLLAICPTRAEGGAFAAVYESVQPGVYRVDPEGLQVNSVMFSGIMGNTLTVIQSPDEQNTSFSLSQVDLHTGSVTASRALYTGEAFPFLAGLLPDGRLYTFTGERPDLTVYNSDLRVAVYHTGSGGNFWHTPLISLEGDALWCADQGIQNLTRIALADGSRTAFQPFMGPPWKFAYYIQADRNRLVYAMQDGEERTLLVELDPASGKQRAAAVPQGFDMVEGGLWANVISDKALVTMPLAGPQMHRIGAWRPGEHAWQYLDGLLMTDIWEETDNSPRIYDINRGVIIGQLSFDEPDRYEVDKPMLAPDGFALVICYDRATERDVFLLWDYAATPLNLDAQITPTSAEALWNACLELAGSMAERYGIGIYFEGEGIGFDDIVYTARPTWDWLLTLTALEEADRVLSALPPGMIAEASLPQAGRISLYLSGQIIQTGTDGIEMPLGFSTATDVGRIIVLDINNHRELAGTLAHELMHVFEDRIVQADDAMDYAMANAWLRLAVPPDEEGGYLYTYNPPDGLDAACAYTGDCQEALNTPGQVYYADAYARTFPMEDRARIFEHLFASEDALPACYDSPPLMMKAEFLCAMIRKSFPSAANSPDPLRWERFVQPLPDSAFEALLGW